MVNKLEIIHILDDEKFVDNAINIFEGVIPNQSKYFVINSSKDSEFKFVKSKKAASIPLYSDGDYQLLKDQIHKSKSKIVFLHALNVRKQKLVKYLGHDIVKVWFVWGYDLYNHWKPLKYSIYEKDTLQFVNRNLNFKSRVLNTLMYQYKLYKMFKFSKSIYKTDYYDVVNSIDIVAPVLPSEMQFIEAINPNITFAPFAYVNLDQILLGNDNSNTLIAKNILVGNSAAQTNNHIEVFKKLARANIGDRKVIVPLSYGDKGDYLQLVLKKGKALLGDNFIPITDFLSLKDYNDLILSCGYTIFNHIRQQAVGNIIAMGYFGAKMIFNKKGVAYNYFDALGMTVFTLDKIDDSLFNSHLSSEEMKKNQDILKNQYSEDSVKEKVKELYRIVEKVHLKKNA